nr:tetratricopeptide repeat protein [Tritonibacter mobilis]
MRILTQNPGNARAHYNLALLAKANGLESKARAYVEAALRREPGNKHYRAFLAKLKDA